MQGESPVTSPKHAGKNAAVQERTDPKPGTGRAAYMPFFLAEVQKIY